MLKSTKGSVIARGNLNRIIKGALAKKGKRALFHRREPNFNLST